MDLVPSVTASLDAQARALRDACGARALEDLAVVSVRGKDRASWLNGLVTNDTRALESGRGVYAAAVAVKGKILTDLFVHARADELLLVMPAARVDEVLAHFDRYIVMEDVTLARLDVAVLSLQGPATAALAERLGERFAADRLGRGGVDVVVPPARRDEVAAALRALVAEGAVAAVSPEAWEAARIEAGVPAFGVDFDGSNFVQEASITPRAVSFHKGCYLGQEVVCRLEMRGHVQRMLVALSLPGDPPARGTAVTSEGHEVGAVTSAARAVDGGSVALAMVKHAAVEKSAPLAVQGVSAAVRKAFGA